MTSIFRRIDDFLFDRLFQPLVDQFPHQGPVGVSRFFMSGAIGGMGTRTIVSIIERNPLDLVVFGISTALFIGNYLVLGLSPPRLGARNFRRIEPCFVFGRALISIGAVFGVLDLATGHLEHAVPWALGQMLFLFCEYASACDLRPPKTRKAPFWQSWFRTAARGA